MRRLTGKSCRPDQPLRDCLLIGLEQRLEIAIVLNPFAALAQLVEHLIRNERVAGSNPASGSINPERVRCDAGVALEVRLPLLLPQVGKG